MQKYIAEHVYDTLFSQIDVYSNKKNDQITIVQNITTAWIIENVKIVVSFVS